MERLASCFLGLALAVSCSLPAQAVVIEISTTLTSLQTMPVNDVIEWSLPDIPITPVTIPAGVSELHEIRVDFVDPSLVKLGQSELLLTDEPGFPNSQTITFRALLLSQSDVPVNLDPNSVARGVKLPDYNGSLDHTGFGAQVPNVPYLHHGIQLSNFEDGRDVQISRVTLTVQGTLAATTTFDRIRLTGRATTVQTIPRLCLTSGEFTHVCDVPPVCQDTKLCYSRRPRDGPLVISTTTASSTTPPNFRSVSVPTPLSGSPAQFELAFQGFTVPLVSGEEYLFETLVPGGVDTFEISGIEAAEVHDPADPDGFVSGVSFVAGSGSESFTLLSSAPTPTPALGAGALALASGLLGAAGYALARWRRSQRVGIPTRA